MVRRSAVRDARVEVSEVGHSEEQGGMDIQRSGRGMDIESGRLGRSTSTESQAETILRSSVQMMTSTFSLP